MIVVNLNRRELLKTTTGLLTGLVCVAGSPLALVAPGRAWAVDLTALTSAEGTELMAVARTIVPHDKLDDAALCDGLSRPSTAMQRKTRAIARCSKKVSLRSARKFAASSENDRVAALKKNGILCIFSSDAAWKAVASSLCHPHGLCLLWLPRRGILKRRVSPARIFNDLRWLPEVPLEGRRADAGQLVGSGELRHESHRSS